jgi:hypothetical protein
MRHPIPLGALCACAWLAGALAASAGPRDPLYQWTDAQGAVRYTSEIERIPEPQRSSALVIAAGRGGVRTAEPPSPAPPSAARPAPAPAAEKPAPVAPVESAPPPSSIAAPTDPKLAAMDARIAELEQKIAADEEALGDYISDPERAAKKDDGGDVAAIADRLPKLQSELRELRAQREAAAHAAAPNDAP